MLVNVSILEISPDSRQITEIQITGN